MRPDPLIVVPLPLDYAVCPFKIHVTAVLISRHGRFAFDADSGWREMPKADQIRAFILRHAGFSPGDATPTEIRCTFNEE